MDSFLLYDTWISWRKQGLLNGLTTKHLWVQLYFKPPSNFSNLIFQWWSKCCPCRTSIICARAMPWFTSCWVVSWWFLILLVSDPLCCGMYQTMCYYRNSWAPNTCRSRFLIMNNHLFGTYFMWHSLQGKLHLWRHILAVSSWDLESDRIFNGPLGWGSGRFMGSSLSTIPADASSIYCKRHLLTALPQTCQPFFDLGVISNAWEYWLKDFIGHQNVLDAIAHLSRRYRKVAHRPDIYTQNV